MRQWSCQSWKDALWQWFWCHGLRGVGTDIHCENRIRSSSINLFILHSLYHSSSLVLTACPRSLAHVYTISILWNWARNCYRVQKIALVVFEVFTWNAFFLYYIIFVMLYRISLHFQSSSNMKICLSYCHFFSFCLFVCFLGRNFFATMNSFYLFYDQRYKPFFTLYWSKRGLIF